jgi:hypothetical protein
MSSLKFLRATGEINPWLEYCLHTVTRPVGQSMFELRPQYYPKTPRSKLRGWNISLSIEKDFNR